MHFAGLRRDEPMSRHTSWRVGGPADLFFKPATLDELQDFLSALPEHTPLTFLGLGSNVLVRDGGIRGAVIATSDFDREITRLDETRVRAGAGATCARLARQCVGWRLGPAAFFAGIPGTVGGALAMNAGAFGGETWERVESVETIDRRGRLRLRQRSDYTIAYRSVRGPREEWFIAAHFAFGADTQADTASIKTLLAQRNATQPLGLPSCGSVFRNPPEAAAGRLIERAGLKGYRVGGAVVSDKHANFIINDGTATAEDIETLIEQIRAEVRRTAGIELEPEVRIVGDRPEARP